MKKVIVIGAIAVVCCVLLYVWYGADSTEAHDHEHEHDEAFLPFSHDLLQTHGIAIDTASPGTLKQRVRAPAQITIVSDQVAHVVPRVSGIAVKAYKNLGESVQANEVLAVLDSKEMAEAKAAYLTAFKRLEFASTAFEREHSLHEKGLVSTDDLRHAESKKIESDIDFELSKQKLHTLGLSYKKIAALPSASKQSMKTYELRSPIAGQVIARHFTPGEVVSNDHEVYVIADLSVVWGEVNVFANDRPHVAVGQPVAIWDHQGNRTEGEVSFLSPVVDQETRTSTALVAIKNEEGQWFPGTFVQAEFVTETTQVPVLIPLEAVQTVDDQDVVFVIQEGGFTVTPVVIGHSDDTMCEVVSGLNQGDRYASKNTFLLKADLKKDEAEHMD